MEAYLGPAVDLITYEKQSAKDYNAEADFPPLMCHGCKKTVYGHPPVPDPRIVLCGWCITFARLSYSGLVSSDTKEKTDKLARINECNEARRSVRKQERERLKAERNLRKRVQPNRIGKKSK